MEETQGTRRLLSDLEAAPLLGLPVQTLRNWRWINVGPPWVRVGDRAIRYDRVDLERYIAEGKVDPARRMG
jgi:hypothetical protein